MTQTSTNSGAVDGSPTGCTYRDRIGFSTEIAPADFGLGSYRDHVLRPPTGLHVDVEQDALGNQTTFGPDEAAGATRIDLGSISGNLESLVEGGGIVTMGTVECVASKIFVDRVTDVSPLSDCRPGVFLLARQALPFNNYGTSSAGSIRFPGPGDCPP